MTNLIAVDNGHSQQKIAWLDEDNKIKTLVLASTISAGLTELDIDGAGVGGYQIEATGNSYTIGGSSPLSLSHKQYAVSEMNAVLVANSIIESGLIGDLKLSTGLPFSYYFANGQKDAVFIEKVIQSTAVKVNPVGPKRANYKIVGHKVYPESTAAYVDWALDLSTGTFKKIENGFCVIDVGGGTTDVTTVNEKGSIDIARSGTSKIGIIDLKSELKDKLIAHLRIDSLKDSTIEKVLRTGKITVYGEEHDVTAILNLVAEKYAQRVHLFASELIGDGAEMDVVLFVGGAANLLGNHIDKLRRVTVPDEPELANVKGMLKLMIMDEQRGASNAA